MNCSRVERCLRNRVYLSLLATSFILYLVISTALHTDKGRYSEIDFHGNETRNGTPERYAGDPGVSATASIISNTSAITLMNKSASQNGVVPFETTQKYDIEVSTKPDRNPNPYYIQEPDIDCSKQRTYIIFVYSRRKQIHRRQLIRNTWGRLEQYNNLTVNVQLFFVLGISDDDDDDDATVDRNTKLEEEVKRYRDILICDVIDSYRNLTLKGLAALKWINSTCDRNNLEFLFKTDDDVYVHLWRVIDHAKKALEMESDFLGVCKSLHRVLRSGKWAVSEDELADEHYPEYCSGGGYGMTRKGFLLLMDSIDKVTPFPIEDVFFTSNSSNTVF